MRFKGIIASLGILSLSTLALCDVSSENIVDQIKMSEVANIYTSNMIEDTFDDKVDYDNHIGRKSPDEILALVKERLGSKVGNIDKKDLALLLDLDLIDIDIEKGYTDIDYNKTRVLNDVLGLENDEANDETDIDDSDIFKVLNKEWRDTTLYSDNSLKAKLESGIKMGHYTGYSIKLNQNYKDIIDSDDYVLVYGHNNIIHARQLVALLDILDVDGEVIFRGKTSSFKYLKEWGEVKNSENYFLDKSHGDQWMAYAREYELVFIFDKKSDLRKFSNIITKYANKNSEEDKGLLYNSWWQPLFYTREQTDGLYHLVDNEIHVGDKIIQIFSTVSAAPNIKKYFNEDNYSIHDIWVNKSFYNYLNGGYK